MRVVDMRRVNFLKLHAFFFTFLKTLQTSGVYGMRVFLKNAFLDMRFLNANIFKMYIFKNNIYFVAKRFKKKTYVLFHFTHEKKRLVK